MRPMSTRMSTTHERQPQTAAAGGSPSHGYTPIWEKRPQSSRTKTISKIKPRLIGDPFRWLQTPSRPRT